ncbi:hypothetical protein AMTR_s00014p00212230 [Amborella trichopoda]|uniref:Uncharacterized protein n=1 Tax=Amborella trichopoda TaxID=13333 RepID=W1PGN7_AMBTC|nr:hypothetical protein AMTR_s00014p00212230 [Amborella trichopoda]
MIRIQRFMRDDEDIEIHKAGENSGDVEIWEEADEEDVVIHGAGKDVEDFEISNDNEGALKWDGDEDYDVCEADDIPEEDDEATVIHGGQVRMLRISGFQLIT